MNRIFYILSFTLLFASCRKDVPPQKNAFSGSITAGQRVFITNEGGFGYNQASISLYDPASQQVISDIYKPNNNNQSLGDICQSLFISNTSIYAVVNNSGKVAVLDKNTFQQTGVINGLNSPRYLLPVSNNKAYVTDLYANAISIVDLNSNTKTGSIPCSGWTEEMVLSFGQVFVTNLRSSYVYVINSTSNTITDSIQVAFGASSIVKDKNEKIWIACGGDSLKSSLPKIVCFDPITHTVEKEFTFTHYYTSPSQLKINAAGDKLFFFNRDIYSLDINASSLSPVPLVYRGNKLFYALGINPYNNDIYVSDAVDYVQNGKVMIYSPNGTFKNSFSADIIPGGIFFE